MLDLNYSQLLICSYFSLCLNCSLSKWAVVFSLSIAKEIHSPKWKTIAFWTILNVYPRNWQTINFNQVKKRQLKQVKPKKEKNSSNLKTQRRLYLIHQIGTHRKIQCIYHEIETQLKICWNKATRKYRMWMNVKTKLEDQNPIKPIEIRGLNETIFVKTKAHLILLANQNQQRNNFKWFSIEIQHLNSVLSVD